MCNINVVRVPILSIHHVAIKPWKEKNIFALILPLIADFALKFSENLEKGQTELKLN